MHRPDMTTVVMTRNRREEVVRCLERADGPVVVVDNGSDDGTALAVRQLRRPSTRLVELGHNHGAQARDIGVDLAGTALVAFADDDSWWAPGALDRAARHFAEHPRLAVLAGRLEIGDDRRLDPVCEAMAAAPWGEADDLPGPDVLGFVACAAVVRRSTFLAAGGFGDVVLFAGEEERVALDLAAGGWGLAYVDDVVARHEPSALRPPSPQRRAAQEFNAVLTAVQRRPWDVVRHRQAQRSGPWPHGRLDAARRLVRALRGRRGLPPELEARARTSDAGFGVRSPGSGRA